MSGRVDKNLPSVTNTTPNSMGSEVKVMMTEVGTTTSLAGTMGDKGVVMAMRVGKVMRRVENTTTRD